MEKIRILIIDESKSSQEAREILRTGKIDFMEIHSEKLSQLNFHIPTLLAPEGQFEGIELVKKYTTAENNGFHKKLEK